jgi:heptosyltransferase-1
VRILIVKTSSMGDVVHALPLAADLAAALPGAHIDWLVEEGFADIPAMSRHVRHVHRIALRRWRKALGRSETWREVAAVRHALYAERYDWAVDVQGLLKSAWMARWANCAVAGPSSSASRERVAALFYTRPVSVPRELHAVQRCRAIGAAVFGYTPDSRPRFDLNARAVPPLQVGGKYAVLLTNASRDTKLWPEAHWIALERWLAARQLKTVLFSGTEAEQQRGARLSTAMRSAVLAPRAHIDAIAATLREARVVVGLDTGLTHLAAALGRPTVGIYCDYDPKLVGLVGEGPVVSLGGIDRSPAVEDVIAAVSQVLGEAR